MGKLMDLLPVRDPKEDVIKSGATKVTTLSAVVGGLAGIDIAFNDNLVKIFDHTPSDGTKTTLLVALVAAWAIIATADQLSRALATSASQPRMFAAPTGLKVHRPEQSGDIAEKDWIVTATKIDPTDPDDFKLLVVKAGERPEWVKASGVVGND